MRLLLPIAMLVSSSGLSAQETRGAQPGEASPPARVAQMDWLVGHWHGTGIDGHAATESWLPATGNTMVGTFVQADAGGEILFTEHMYLREEDGSLVLQLKHFNPDLTGWEAQGDSVSFPLLALEPCRAQFAGLTIRCDGPDALVIAVRVSEAEGSAGELVFRYARMD
jgi:hypothetical protein